MLGLQTSGARWVEGGHDLPPDGDVSSTECSMPCASAGARAANRQCFAFHECSCVRVPQGVRDHPGVVSEGRGPRASETGEWTTTNALGPGTSVWLKPGRGSRSALGLFEDRGRAGLLIWFRRVRARTHQRPLEQVLAGVLPATLAESALSYYRNTPIPSWRFASSTARSTSAGCVRSLANW